MAEGLSVLPIEEVPSIAKKIMVDLSLDKEILSKVRKIMEGLSMAKQVAGKIIR